jgi:hypothetical protein
MVRASQIRKVVAQYLFDSNIDEFVLRFGDLSHNIHLFGESDAIVLSRKIESKLNDARLGCIERDDLRKELCNALTQDVVTEPSAVYVFVEPEFVVAPNAPVSSVKFFSDATNDTRNRESNLIPA